MDLDEVIRRRRMVRSFSDRPLDHGVLDRIVASALRAPSAGNTRGTAWVVLEGPPETRRYWDAVTTPAWRARSARWEGLSRAPAVLVSLACPSAYVARYGEPDKAASGLGPGGGPGPQASHGGGGGPAGRVRAGERPAGGGGAEAGVAGGETSWPVPYWWGDAGFAVLHVLLTTVAEGLGACFLGNFRGEDALVHELHVPSDWRVFGAVVLGHPDGNDHRSSSLDRPGPLDAARVHHGRWRADGS